MAGSSERFSSEKELVELAMRHLPLRQWLRLRQGSALYQRKEVQGLFGIPDLLAVDVSRARAGGRGAVPSLAFEMKLRDWKRGLIQAFRYRCFATAAFVVLDNSCARPARDNIAQFERANVGLIGINRDGTSVVYYWPQREAPFDRGLHSTLTKIVRDETEAD